MRAEGEIALAMVFVPASGPGSRDAARAAAEALREAATGDAAAFAAAVGATEGAVLREMPLRGDVVASLRDDVEEFLGTAPVGVPGPVFATDKGFLVVVKRGETRGDPLPFEEVQGAIEKHLYMVKRGEAARALVDDLLREADVWPERLRPPPAGSTEPAGDGG
jgi:hypothetical protein